MKVIITGFLVTVFLFGILVNAGLTQGLVLPNLPETTIEEWTSTEKEKGTPRSQFTTKIEIGTENGKKFVRYTEEGKGFYEGSKEHLKWNILVYVYADPYLRPHYAKREIYSLAGELKKTDTFEYDYSSKKIYFTSKEQATTKKTLELKDNTFDVYALSLAMLCYPFKEQKDIKLNLITPAIIMFPFKFCYMEKEKVNTPAGNFDCHKIKIAADWGLMNVTASFIMPKNYYWFSDTTPPMRVKTEELEGSTPYVIKQLTKRSVIQNVSINSGEN